jgi:Flp pilus assembly protein TadG
LLAGLLAAPIKTFDMVESASQRNTDAQTALDNVRKALRRGQGGIAGQVNTQKTAVGDWSWRADNIDVGKVMIQNNLSELADKAGLAGAEVKVDEKLQTAGDVQLVSLEITAPFTWPGLSGFLAGLQATGKGFILDQVQLPDDDKPRLKITLRAPLMINAAIAPVQKVQTRTAVRP